MTAAEMIAALQELNPDEVIYTNDPGCGCCDMGAVEASLDYTEEYVEGETGTRNVWMVN